MTKCNQSTDSRSDKKSQNALCTDGNQRAVVVSPGTLEYRINGGGG